MAAHDKDGNVTPFAHAIPSSEAFQDAFRDGMALFEETAAYLDGPGRQEAKNLSRAATLAYATESTRLTTRLMRLASWLLLHRAVREGEMTLTQATNEKQQVIPKLGNDDACRRPELLPARFHELIARSKDIEKRVLRLNAAIDASVPDAAPANEPLALLARLKEKFEK